MLYLSKIPPQRTVSKLIKLYHLDLLNAKWVLFLSCFIYLFPNIAFSQQTTKKIAKVVIDPGHGGKDSGTMGTKRYKKYEKDIACQTSLLGDEFEEIVKLFAPVVRAMFPVLGTDKVLVRNSRFNLIDNKNSKNHTPFHRDLDCDHWVAVYYLNDADGDTIIFDEGEAKYVFPKRDRMLFWPGQFHAIDLSKDIVNRKIYNFSFTIKNPA